MDDLVGAEEIAERLGLRHVQSVHTLRRRHPTFPEPVKKLQRTMIWSLQDVRKWAEETERVHPVMLEGGSHAGALSFAGPPPAVVRLTAEAHGERWIELYFYDAGQEVEGPDGPLPLMRFMKYGGGQCPTCGQSDTVEPIDTVNPTGGQHTVNGGAVVRSGVCDSCGAEVHSGPHGGWMLDDGPD